MSVSFVKLNTLDNQALCQECKESFTGEKPALAHDGRDPIHAGCLQKKILEHKADNSDEAILKCGACFDGVSDILGTPVQKPLPNREYTQLLANQLDEKPLENETAKPPVAKQAGVVEKYRLKTAAAVLGTLAVVYAVWTNRASLIPGFGPGLGNEMCTLDENPFALNRIWNNEVCPFITSENTGTVLNNADSLNNSSSVNTGSNDLDQIASRNQTDIPKPPRGSTNTCSLNDAPPATTCSINDQPSAQTCPLREEPLNYETCSLSDKPLDKTCPERPLGNNTLSLSEESA